MTWREKPATHTTLVGPRGPRVAGMGAPGLAGPIEPGGALDDGPAPDVDFEAGGMFEGVGGEGRQTEEDGQPEGGCRETC